MVWIYFNIEEFILNIKKHIFNLSNNDSLYERSSLSIKKFIQISLDKITFQDLKSKPKSREYKKKNANGKEIKLLFFNLPTLDTKVLLSFNIAEGNATGNNFHVKTEKLELLSDKIIKDETFDYENNISFHCFIDNNKDNVCTKNAQILVLPFKIYDNKLNISIFVKSLTNKNTIEMYVKDVNGNKVQSSSKTLGISNWSSINNSTSLHPPSSDFYDVFSFDKDAILTIKINGIKYQAKLSELNWKQKLNGETEYIFLDFAKNKGHVDDEEDLKTLKPSKSLTQKEKNNIDSINIQLITNMKPEFY